MSRQQAKGLPNIAPAEAGSAEAVVRQVLSRLNDALFIADREGGITYLNQAAEEMTGLSSSEAAGRPSREVFANVIGKEGVFPAINLEDPDSIRQYRCFYFGREGKKVPVNLTVSPLTDPEGKTAGQVGVLQDVSKSRTLEDEWHFSENQYRQIFEGSRDLIFIASEDGLIKDVNQAGVDLLKYHGKAEVLALASVEKIFWNPMHWAVFRKQIDRHGSIKDFEAGFKRKDGTFIHCLLSGNAVRNWIGEIVGYEAIAKDVTARMDAHRILQQRHRDLQVLTSVALAMNTSQDLDDILRLALTKVLSALNLSSGGIFLIDHDQGAYLLRAQQGLPEVGADTANRIVFSDRLLMGELLKKNLHLAPEPIFPPFKAFLQGENGASLMELICFLITAKEKACGFMAFLVPANRDLASGEDYHLLGSLGNFLGGAIENAKLLETIRQHREELKGLTADLFHSQEGERKRIAQELHDEAGQALTGIHFTLETIEKSISPESVQTRDLIAEVKRRIHRTYQEMRNISYSLHPAILSDLGLEPALDSYVANLSRHRGIEIDFKMIGFEKRLDPDMETILYRLSQEALTNSLKHARAKHIKLSLIKSYPRIIFVAEDDGVGFERPTRSSQSLGLLGMRERASMLGGNFSIRSNPGQGTRIRIEIPIREAPDG
jgi:PAS domain S-box-containing protein